MEGNIFSYFLFLSANVSPTSIWSFNGVAPVNPSSTNGIQFNANPQSYLCSNTHSHTCSCTHHQQEFPRLHLHSLPSGLPLHQAHLHTVSHSHSLMHHQCYWELDSPWPHSYSQTSSHPLAANLPVPPSLLLLTLLQAQLLSCSNSLMHHQCYQGLDHTWPCSYSQTGSHPLAANLPIPLPLPLLTLPWVQLQQSISLPRIDSLTTTCTTGNLTPPHHTHIHRPAYDQLLFTLPHTHSGLVCPPSHPCPCPCPGPHHCPYPLYIRHLQVN